ncbi:putative aminophospholipid-translocase, partial [Ascosphaera pollenicola]
MSTSSQDEFAAVEGEEFFKSLVQDVAKDVEDADADADSGDLEPQLEAEIGSELQINARAPAMQAQAEAQMRQTPTTAIAPAAAAHLVPTTIGTVEQFSSTPAQILDSTRELDDQLQFQQQRQQPPPAQVQAAVAAESSPNDGFSPAQFAVHQSDINNLTTSTTTTNNVIEPIPPQESIFAAQIEPQDPSTTSSEHISHSRNPSHHSTVHTGTSTVTPAQQSSQPLPPSVPASTPVEYYLPNRHSSGDGTAQVTDPSGVPAAAINTEEGLGIQTSYVEVPAPAPMVVGGERYEILRELPKPQRDMPVLDADSDITAEAGSLSGAGDAVRQVFKLEEAVQQQEQREQRVENGGTDTKANNQVTVTQGHPRIEAPSVQQDEAMIVHEGPATQFSAASSANNATLQEDTIQQHAHAEIPTAPQEIVWGSLAGTPLAIQTSNASASVEVASPEKNPAGIADRGNVDIIQPATQVKTPPQQDADSLVLDRRPSGQVSVASAENYGALQQDAVVQQQPPNEWLNPQGDADNLSLERIPSVQESVASTADKPIITEGDLEERWKAMGIDDAELLDEMLPEEDV